jgi:prepilin-type processing-associated H-X9-DG protein
MRQRDKKQTSLRVEPLEGRALLSTTAGAVAVPASLVRGVTYLFVDGHAHGKVHAERAIPDIGGRLDLKGTAVLNQLGKVSVSGTLSGTGFIAQGHAGATLTLANSKGTVILSLIGPTQGGFKAAPSGTYTFGVEGGTGQYAHVVGHGTVDLTYNARTFSLAFHGGVNNA